jgi:hypothetical protein
LTFALALPAAFAQDKTLRIAMTAADIPRTLGQPDQGFEGNRFTGIRSMTRSRNGTSRRRMPEHGDPGLANSWAVDAKDKTKWVFKLHPASSSMTARLSTPMPWSGTCARCSTRKLRISIPARSA